MGASLTGSVWQVVDSPAGMRPPMSLSGRLAFSADGTLLLTVGDGGTTAPTSSGSDPGAVTAVPRPDTPPQPRRRS
jgi:hypothetical protein